jgi:adenosyl cobinamide kinase/adenosyl cobinamide phosphate guanylyltransferase
MSSLLDRSSGDHIPPDEAADNQAVIDHVLTGRPLDAEIARRIEERAERIRQRIFQEHGLVDIGVPAIRELRGPLPES